MTLVSWLRQPTTVAGGSALLGTAVAVLLKDLTPVAAIPLVAGALASIAMPDNTSAKADVQSLATALGNAITAGKIDPTAIAPLVAPVVGDIEKAVQQ